MCQDGEASISRFNGDLCSSWKPCESMTARQIKPPYPRWLRHLNWQWLGWLCPNHWLCCSSSEASSWTEEMQTIDTLHIFQWWTCQRSLWLQTLLSYSSCWCHWTSRQRGVNKVHRSQNITPIHFLPLISDFNIWRLWVVSHFTVLCILPNITSFCREERLCQCAKATKPRSCFISTGTVCCRAINNHRHTFKSLLLFSEVSRYFLFKKCLNESVRAVINSLLWGGVQGRWCEVVLQQVEATAEHMPSGNQAALLYRDSGVITSQSLLLLGAGVSHKHHLPEEADAHSEHLSAGRVTSATRPLRKTKGSASSHCLMSVRQLSVT